MSRIGKLPIAVPTGVTVVRQDAQVTVRGPKGELSLTLHPHVELEQSDSQLTVRVAEPDVKQDRALWGLTRALVQNMVTGVTQGFEKRLEINGVGYRAEVKGRSVVLALGYSHPIEYALPDGIDVTVEKNQVAVRGINKQLVGEVAAELRRLRKPEPYKGKGIKYVDEVIRRKAGKVVKTAGAK